VREEERHRLRRDLHDGLGPILAGLALGLETAAGLLTARKDSHELQQLLARLKAEAQRALGDMRRIAGGLAPPALDELGLAGSLREEIARLRHEAPFLTISLHTPGSELASLPPSVKAAAYRVVTEALTNVARHSHARSCSVRIQLDQFLTVEVSDDGTGLPELWRAGIGIAAMRERVAELGGDLVIETRHPRGTRIVATFLTRRPR
jgi:signal transduction histidine kinase